MVSCSAVSPSMFNLNFGLDDAGSLPEERSALFCEWCDRKRDVGCSGEEKESPRVMIFFECDREKEVKSEEERAELVRERAALGCSLCPKTALANRIETFLYQEANKDIVLMLAKYSLGGGASSDGSRLYAVHKSKNDMEFFGQNYFLVTCNRGLSLAQAYEAFLEVGKVAEAELCFQLLRYVVTIYLYTVVQEYNPFAIS